MRYLYPNPTRLGLFCPRARLLPSFFGVEGAEPAAGALREPCPLLTWLYDAAFIGERV